MSNLYWKEVNPGVFKTLFTLLLGLLFMVTMGCKPSSGDGDIITELLLPTDTQLTLECPNVGIWTESCILDDPLNPYRDTGISEFNNETGEEGNKFDLDAAIPLGPTGAKARFYFWATALAFRSSGENQWYTARALHELWSAQPVKDPQVRAQALKAYRSILDHYFGSVTFFDFVDPPISVQLNKWVGYDLLCPNTTLKDLFSRPAPGGPTFIVEGTIAEWGFTYIPPLVFFGLDAGGECDPVVEAEDGQIFENVF